MFQESLSCSLWIPEVFKTQGNESNKNMWGKGLAFRTPNLTPSGRHLPGLRMKFSLRVDSLFEGKGLNEKPQPSFPAELTGSCLLERLRPGGHRRGSHTLICRHTALETTSCSVSPGVFSRQSSPNDLEVVSKYRLLDLAVELRH